MIDFRIGILFLFISSVSFFSAQNEGSFIRKTKFYTKGFDSSDFEELKMEEARVSFQMSGLSYATKNYFVVSKLNSEAQYSIGSLPEIYVRFEEENDSSLNNIVMIKGEIQGNDRKFLRAHMNGWFKVKDIKSIYQKLEFEKVSDGMYKIIFDKQKLSTGEYLIYDHKDLPKSSFQTLFLTCFGLR